MARVISRLPSSERRDRAAAKRREREQRRLARRDLPIGTERAEAQLAAAFERLDCAKERA